MTNERHDEMQSRLTTDLARLTAIDGVSGHEQDVVAYLQERFEPLADSVEVDAMGNLYAHHSGGDGPHLMVEAHSDEIGGIVSDITENGFLRFQIVGGASEMMLIGRKIRVKGQRGIVGVRSGHLQTENERRTVPDIEDLYIDLGFDTREDVAGLGIRAGDQITWQSELEPVANPNRVAGKAIDNRIGCLILLELLRSLQGQDLPGPLTVVIAVQEEVGLKGARVATQRVRPDAALVIDTVPCADTPDAHAPTFPVRLGRGPVFQVTSGRHASGYLMPESIRDFLIRVSAEANIPYQLATFAYGNTDASAIYDSPPGIPTAVATLPRRYSHSPVELLDLSDARAAVTLCQEVVRRVREFPAGMSISSHSRSQSPPQYP